MLPTTELLTMPARVNGVVASYTMPLVPSKLTLVTSLLVCGPPTMSALEFVTANVPVAVWPPASTPVRGVLSCRLPDSTATLVFTFTPPPATSMRLPVPAVPMVWVAVIMLPAINVVSLPALSTGTAALMFRSRDAPMVTLPCEASTPFGSTLTSR